MPKRALTSSPLTTKGKKSKVAKGQSSLDHFFGGSDKTLNSNTNGQSSLDHYFSGSQGQSDTTRNSTKDEGKLKALDDRTYAEALAKEDGIDLATTRRLEAEWKESKKQPLPPDIIDVDFVNGKIETDSIDTPGTASGSGSGHPARAQSSRHQSPETRANSFPIAKQPALAPVAYSILSIDPLAYILDDDPWPRENAVPYSFLSHTLATLSETRSRILIINTLTNCLRTISRHDPASLLPALYLLSNSLSPPYLPIELGLGHSIISKSIQQVSGLTHAALKRLYTTTGDVGDVAFEAKSNLRTLVPHPPLLVSGVFNALLKISNCKGQGAAKQKQSIVEKLLVSAKGEETRFLVRTLSMNLRVGAVRTSILTALAKAMVLTHPSTISGSQLVDSPYHATEKLITKVDSLPVSPKKKSNTTDSSRDAVNERFALAESLMRKIYVQHPNYDHIVSALLEAGLDGLAERVPLAVGIPLHPTLGSPTRSLDEIYDRLGELPFAAEYKYDGQRAQIHCRKTNSGDVEVKIFSRHLEDMTTKYPDVVSLMQAMFSSTPSLQSFIIDSEIVAIDPVDGSLKTFQELSNRARKDVQIQDVKVAVGIYAFDLMYFNEEILLEKPFRKRRSLLRERLPPFILDRKELARFGHVESCESEDGRGTVEEFWQKAVASRCEGLMIKLLDSGEVLEEPGIKKEKVRRKPLPATYEPDKRTLAWLKLKKDYVTGLGDSLDLVPIGAWHGNGRKSQWWSPVLLALRDGESGKLVAVCKCMSGFSDIFYKAMRERYSEHSETCSPQNLWGVDTGGLRPEVFFNPSEVWEIRGAESGDLFNYSTSFTDLPSDSVTLSPVSVAAMGLVHNSRGLSLRFPRFIKIREDKTIEQTSDAEFLANMWKIQQGKQADEKGADEGDLMDVEFEDGSLEEEDSDS